MENKGKFSLYSIYNPQFSEIKIDPKSKININLTKDIHKLEFKNGKVVYDDNIKEKDMVGNECAKDETSTLYNKISELNIELEKMKEERNKAVNQINQMIFELNCCDKCTHFEKGECTHFEEICDPEWNGLV